MQEAGSAYGCALLSAQEWDVWYPNDHPQSLLCQGEASVAVVDADRARRMAAS